MGESDDPRRREFERRTVLRVLGGGAALGAVPGLGAGRGPPDHAGNGGRSENEDGNGNGDRGRPAGAGAPEECCEEGTFLAKYELEDGAFVLDEGSDAVTFSDVEYKDGDSDEVVAFCWESGARVSGGCVKHATESESLSEVGSTDEERLSGCVDLGEDSTAVSHVTFCSDVTYYQIDFVAGEPIESDCCTMESYGDRLLASAFGDTEDAVTERVSGQQLSNEHDHCFEVSGGDAEPHDRIGDIEVDGEDVTVTFTPEDVGEEDCPEELSLVTYVVTNPPYSTDDQELYDAVTEAWDDLDLGDENELTTTVPN